MLPTVALLFITRMLVMLTLSDFFLLRTYRGPSYRPALRQDSSNGIWVIANKLRSGNFRFSSSNKNVKYFSSAVWF